MENLILLQLGQDIQIYLIQVTKKSLGDIKSID